MRRISPGSCIPDCVQSFTIVNHARLNKQEYREQRDIFRLGKRSGQALLQLPGSGARAGGLDPGGHAHGFLGAIVVETPLPWRHAMMQKAGPLPQEMIDMLNVWLQEYKDGKGYSHLPLAIAPDPECSCPGFRRVMLYTRPAGLMTQFDKVEYLVPENECGSLVWSLYQDRDRLLL